MSEDRKLPLKDVIHQLKSEILAAVDAADDTPEGRRLAFELEAVQLELQVGVTREGHGKTKAKFWVLDFEVGGKRSDAETQKVVLSLKPKKRNPDEDDDSGDQSVLLSASVDLDEEG